MDSESTSILAVGTSNLAIPRCGDAGHDIKADRIIKEVKGCIVYGTGVKLAPSDLNVHALVCPRSSIKDYDLQLVNSPAVIDSSYRGEIMLVFRKVAGCQKFYKVGDKIAQLLFIRTEPVNIETIAVDEFEKLTTERGENGFGSTGK